jgi:NtrC-family two-component system sensor histidine kinase KinB
LTQLYDVLAKISRLNQDAVLATSQNVKRFTANVIRWMVVGMAVALLISFVSCYQLARSILGPIQLLTKATREAGAGNLDQLVPVISNDELGELARSFNKMAAQLRVYRESTTEKIKRLHRTMETTLASLPDPIFLLDTESRIEFRNSAAEDWARTFPPPNELPAALRETVGKVLISGQNFLPDSYKEAISVHLNDQPRHFLPRVLAMRNQEEVVFGVAVVLYDVTQFRLLDDVKTSLVTTASHELKTPLTSVRMALHLLTEKHVTELSPRQQEMLLIAREDSEGLLRILNNLLDLARLEEGENGLYKEELAADELVRTSLDELTPKAMAKGLIVNRMVAPDLPPVRVDRHRIGLVFSNLINNAIKHSPSGAEIVLRAVRSGDHGVQFSVIDHGPGIASEYQQRIFDRFFRVPGQTKTGTGLGLSIAREVVLAHAGHIGVKSRPGRGSEFYFVLPSVEEDEAGESKVVAEVAHRNDAAGFPLALPEGLEAR